MMQNKKALARLLRKKKAAAVLMQSVVRGRRDRNRVKEIRRLKKLKEEREFRASQRVQANYRGTLDRRAFVTERHLKRIHEAHPKVMKEALKKKFGEHVFWYDREAELKLLFKDYRLLVQRTGYQPP